MDIKAEIEKIIAQVTKDGDLKEKFMKDPAGAVKGIVGEVDKDTLEKIMVHYEKESLYETFAE